MGTTNYMFYPTQSFIVSVIYILIKQTNIIMYLARCLVILLVAVVAYHKYLVRCHVSQLYCLTTSIW